MRDYILITTAHNEEAFVERTLQSVLSQTVLPRKWIVVDDASTDRTADILSCYQAASPYLIEVLRIQRPPGRDFRNKVRAFNLALERARAIGFSYIGNLDADISLPPDYYQRVLQRFESQPRLGIVGGMVSSLIDGRFVSQEVSADSVAGAVQLFHRDCFEQVGGYLPLTHGGIDAAAEITARKLGWTVRTFADIRVFEHRRTGTASSTALSARRKEGVRLHSLGYGLAFFLIRCVRRSMERPLLIGSATALYGYVEAAMRREQIVLPSDVVRYLRSEQRRKMLRFIGFGRHPY